MSANLSKDLLGCVLALQQVCVVTRNMIVGETAWDLEWLSEGLAPHLKNKRFMANSVFVDELLLDLVELGRSGARICLSCTKSSELTDVNMIVMIGRASNTLHRKLSAAATSAAKLENNPSAVFYGALLFDSATVAADAWDAASEKLRATVGAEQGTSRLLASARNCAIGGSVARAALAFTKGLNNGSLEAVVGLALAEKGAHSATISKAYVTLQTGVLQQKVTGQRLQDLCKGLVRACVQLETDLMNAAMDEAIEERGVTGGPPPARLSQLPSLKKESSSKLVTAAELRWSSPADLLGVALGGERLRDVMLTSSLWADDELFLEMLLGFSSSAHFKEAVTCWVSFYPHVLAKDTIRSKLQRCCPDILKSQSAKLESISFSSVTSSLLVPAKVPLERLLLSFPAVEWARQMCLADAELFLKIEPLELLNQIWTKPKLRHLCSNLKAFINHSNAVSFFVSSSILLQQRQQDRARAFSQGVAIAAELLQLNNFSSFFAVCAGLLCVPVHRLSKTIASVDLIDLDLFASFKSGLMNNSGNFSVYRKQESSATGPVIPYLALHLRDLIYIAENKLFNEEGELNFAGNLGQHARVIVQLQDFQSRSRSYDFKPTELKSILCFPPHFPSEPDGDNLSRSYEPRKQ